MSFELNTNLSQPRDYSITHLIERYGLYPSEFVDCEDFESITRAFDIDNDDRVINLKDDILMDDQIFRKLNKSEKVYLFIKDWFRYRFYFPVLINLLNHLAFQAAYAHPEDFFDNVNEDEVGDDIENEEDTTENETESTNTDDTIKSEWNENRRQERENEDDDETQQEIPDNDDFSETDELLGGDIDPEKQAELEAHHQASLNRIPLPEDRSARRTRTRDSTDDEEEFAIDADYDPEKHTEREPEPDYSSSSDDEDNTRRATQGYQLRRATGTTIANAEGMPARTGTKQPSKGVSTSNSRRTETYALSVMSATKTLLNNSPETTRPLQSKAEGDRPTMSEVHLRLLEGAVSSEVRIFYVTEYDHLLRTRSS